MRCRIFIRNSFVLLQLKQYLSSQRGPNEVCGAAQIQEYLAKPEILRAEAFRDQQRKISKFLDNFYRNIPNYEPAVDINKTLVPG